MRARLDDPTTWAVVLLRCPECSTTVVPDGTSEHQAFHRRWQIGEYMTGDGQPVLHRKDADAMYVGSGKAIFFAENRMRYVGYERAA